MAKTKRRSCKGGRKSRKCRGGVSYFNLPFRERQKYYDHARFSETQQYPSRLGVDTRQPKQVLQIGPTPKEIDRIGREAKNYMRMRRIRELARGVSASAKNTANRFKESVLGFPGTLRDSTASAFRGLGASVSGMYQMLLRFPKFEKDKLVRANMETFGSHGVQNYLYNEHGDILSSDGDDGRKFGQFYKEADGKHYPYFLPDHYDPAETWTMSQMDPTKKYPY